MAHKYYELILNKNMKLSDDTPYFLNIKYLLNYLLDAESRLKVSEKIKFQRLSQWRKDALPDYPGVYCLYEKTDGGFNLLYVGETGNIRDRMSDICRTFNHTFRKQLGKTRFKSSLNSGKFDSTIELLLDKFFDELLYVSFIKVNFGRTEIEEFIVTQNQSILLNSVTKRKLKVILDDSCEI